MAVSDGHMNSSGLKYLITRTGSVGKRLFFRLLEFSVLGKSCYGSRNQKDEGIPREILSISSAPQIILLPQV